MADQPEDGTPISPAEPAPTPTYAEVASADLASSTESSQSSLVSKPKPQLKSYRDQLLLGKIVFIGLRAADPVIQYCIFTQGWGHATLRYINIRPSLPLTGILSPRQTLLITLCSVTVARQIYWLLSLSENAVTSSEAVHVSLFNLTVDTLNSILSLTVPGWYCGMKQCIGAAIFGVGSLVETVSELQRKYFKKDKKNRGKVNNTGLFRWARHINYGGYVIWRFGYALCTGSVYAMWNPAMHLWDFTARGIPALDAYMSHKHKDEWAEYKRTTTWKMLPFLW
ncbi:hypothetical protein HDU85_000909 [Gaertneriomyces sp. JEL0708]|nr:hypothetical protein HDU85_000909 [Gaertneriomyces sp. JEL0708]